MVWQFNVNHIRCADGIRMCLQGGNGFVVIIGNQSQYAKITYFTQGKSLKIHSGFSKNSSNFCKATDFIVQENT